MSEIDDLARKTVFSISPYVPGKPIEEVQREFGIADVIKLASNENPLGPSPMAMEALRSGIANVNYLSGRQLLLPEEGPGGQPRFTEDQLIIGNGSDEILKLIAKAFLNPGEELIFAKPTFSEYEFVGRVMDAAPVAVPVNNNFAHDLQAMAGELGADEDRLHLQSQQPHRQHCHPG